MKKLLTILLVVAVHSSIAQVSQSGVPARMTVEGAAETIPVYLQRVEDDNLVFQILRRPQDRSGPLDRIAYLEFLAPLDETAAMADFNNANYQGFIDKVDTGLEFETEQYWPFMAIENSFQEVFSNLMVAYLKTGQTNVAAQAAAALLKSSEPTVMAKGQTMQVQLLLGEGRFDEAEAMLAEVESPAATLYLTACIQQARELYQEALWTLSDLIQRYPNDLEWMPKAEFRSALVYQDFSADEPEIYMDSAIHTARQVASIYAGTHYAADAERLRQEMVVAKEKAEAEAQAREAAAAQQQAEVRERRLERAERARAELESDEENDNVEEVESGEQDALNEAEGEGAGAN